MTKKRLRSVSTNKILELLKDGPLNQAQIARRLIDDGFGPHTNNTVTKCLAKLEGRGKIECIKRPSRHDRKDRFGLWQLAQLKEAKPAEYTEPIHDHGYYPTAMKKEGK